MKKLEVKNWDEIQDMDFSTEEPIINGLLYNGTYLFVGSPKIGKSFFMLELCYHIASNLPLWGRSVKSGTTLYLAREDDFKRIQKRMYLMYGVGSNEKMMFAIESEGITSGLIDQLEGFIKEHPDTRVIIMDTLQKVRGDGTGADQYNYGADYDLIGKLKDFTDKNRVCVILVHHTRKMEADDPFDMISGSNGLLGAVDGAFVMYKKQRLDKEAKLCVTGRDIEDMELTLEKNSSCIWQCTSITSDIGNNNSNGDLFLNELVSFLDSVGGNWSGSATDLLNKLPKTLNIDTPSVLSRKINITKDDLWKDYGYRFENKRTSENRTLTFTIDDMQRANKIDNWIPVDSTMQMEIPFVCTEENRNFHNDAMTA